LKRVATAVALIGATLAAPALAQPAKGASVVADQVEAVVTVVSVDPKSRQVVVRGPRGNEATLTVPKEAQNLDKVKKGSRFKMKYMEAMALSIHKGGAPNATASEDVTLAPKGGNPGGMVVHTAQISAVIDAIDYTNRYIAVRGPKQNTLALKAADDVKLEELNAGDRIALTYTRALAMEMIPQPAAEKPAPKKKAAAKKKEG
jgi:hypothetical protein